MTPADPTIANLIARCRLRGRIWAGWEAWLAASREALPTARDVVEVLYPARVPLARAPALTWVTERRVTAGADFGCRVLLRGRLLWGGKAFEGIAELDGVGRPVPLVEDGVWSLDVFRGRLPVGGWNEGGGK